MCTSRKYPCPTLPPPHPHRGLFCFFKTENYRGITLLSALGKLFTSILNDRLYDYMTKKGILKAEQGGFKKWHGTVDSIFILKTLIDTFVKSKPQKRRNLLSRVL